MISIDSTQIITKTNLLKTKYLPLSLDVIGIVISYNEIVLLNLLCLNSTIRESLLERIKSGDLKIEKLALNFRKIKYIPKYANFSFWIIIFSEESKKDLEKLRYFGKSLDIFKKLKYSGDTTESRLIKYYLEFKLKYEKIKNPRLLARYFTNVTHLIVTGIIEHDYICFSNFKSLEYFSAKCNSSVFIGMQDRLKTFINYTYPESYDASDEYNEKSKIWNAEFEQIKNIEHLECSNILMKIKNMGVFEKVKYCDCATFFSSNQDYIKFIPNVESLIVSEMSFPGKYLNLLKNLKELTLLQISVNNISLSFSECMWIQNIISIKIQSGTYIKQLYNAIYNHNLKQCDFKKKLSFKKLKKFDISYSFSIEILTILEDKEIFPLLNAVFMKKISSDKTSQIEKELEENKNITFLFN
jgi:hypothetical protein